MKHDPEDPFGWPTPDVPESTRPAPGAPPVTGSAEPEGIPPTDPAGALVPPPKVPGTALAAAAEPPPPERVRVESREERRLVIGGKFDLIATVNRVLDTLDVVGDTIAHVTGIRARNG